MSMISEQIKSLRCTANTMEFAKYPSEFVHQLRCAADTIEELSAKLANANMERSTAHYNDGWIPCSERLPNRGTNVIAQDYAGYMEIGIYKMKNGMDGFEVDGWWSSLNNYIAWRELPQPYKGE